jgi:hypothetical protein
MHVPCLQLEKRTIITVSKVNPFPHETNDEVLTQFDISLCTKNWHANTETTKQKPGFVVRLILLLPVLTLHNFMELKNGIHAGPLPFVCLKDGVSDLSDL